MEKKIDGKYGDSLEEKVVITIDDPYKREGRLPKTINIKKTLDKIAPLYSKTLNNPEEVSLGFLYHRFSNSLKKMEYIQSGMPLEIVIATMATPAQVLREIISQTKYYYCDQPKYSQIKHPSGIMPNKGVSGIVKNKIVNYTKSTSIIENEDQKKLGHYATISVGGSEDDKDYKLAQILNSLPFKIVMIDSKTGACLVCESKYSPEKRFDGKTKTCCGCSVPPLNNIPIKSIIRHCNCVDICIDWNYEGEYPKIPEINDESMNIFNMDYMASRVPSLPDCMDLYTKNVRNIYFRNFQRN